MTAKPNYFRLGVFILSGLFLIFAGIIVLGAGEIFRRGVLAETYLDESVEGLSVGAAVKNRGVEIGKVTRIGFVRTKYPPTSQEEEIRFGRYILVEMELDSRIMPGVTSAEPELLRRRIDAGLRLRLAQGGLTGPVFINADYLDPKTNPPLAINWTPKATYVPSASSTMGQVVSAMERVSRQLEEAELDKVIANVDKLVLNMDSAVTNLRTHEVSEQLVGLLAEVRQTNRQLETIMESAAPMAEYLRRISRRLNTLVAGESRNVQAIINDLRQTAANVKTATEDAQKHPSRVLFGDPPPKSEPGE